jgi:hypothetical protein
MNEGEGVLIQATIAQGIALQLLDVAGLIRRSPRHSDLGTSPIASRWTAKLSVTANLLVVV